MKLNLGSHRKPLAGYVNVDWEPHPTVDLVADLEKPWPFRDNSVDAIYCNDFPEHLRQWYEEADPAQVAIAEAAIERDSLREALQAVLAALRRPQRTYGVFHFMNEANRVLKVGGTLTAKIPSTDGRGWAQDPTHVSFWNENTTLYFRDGFGEQTLYPGLKRGRWGTHYVVTTEPNPIGVRNLTFELEKVKEG